MPDYKKPPITESVIEVRLEQAVSSNMTSKVVKKVRSGYSQYQEREEIVAELNVSPGQVKASAAEQQRFYHLSSNDSEDVLQVWPGKFVCSRLAPYCGWAPFRDRAKSNWETWYDVAGYQKIGRLGLRYINRFDLPMPDIGRIDVEDYLNFVPRYPEPSVFVSFQKYLVQVNGVLRDNPNYHVTIRSTPVPPPLLDHISIVLDIDLTRVRNVPQKNDDLWEVFEEMRNEKNNVFEECITDKARGLFNQ